MAVTLSNKLRDLLLASNLGLSRDHRLAGWNVLTILYHDGATSGVVTTLGTLLQVYNANYLELDERPLTDIVLKRVLDVLSDQAKLVEVAPRKVRLPMKNGAYHIQQSFVYKITSSGIEYLTMMQRVIDADNTVTANITRIQEYCDLVVKLTDPSLAADSTQLYNDFQNMLAAYADVMKGMHKLDEDLSELANDLAFNHGGEAASHLQEMLRDRAIPAFRKLLAQGPRLQSLANSTDFSQRVARSQQGSDDLDAAHAVGDQGKMLIRFQKARDYTQRQLDRLAASFDPSPTAIDSSMDTVYLLFQTILDAIRLLSQEYDHIQGQTVDIQALTGKIDELLTHYQSIVVRQPLPRHLPQDREVDDVADLLDATTMGAVVYEAVPQRTVTVTEADNPQLADDDPDVADDQEGLAEFQRVVMQRTDYGEVNHDLEMTSIHARDELIRLYSATGIDHYDSFAPFGRPVVKVEALPDSQPVHVHCGDESYTVTLPSGFAVWFAPTADSL
ncbi:hypothetical protein [Levilactobacillus andaensis]|uniref:hypothetical protein n=1 Tax=Levilactobacillus andaensis TaxID=2799570 RepID=UPI001944CE21